GEPADFRLAERFGGKVRPGLFQVGKGDVLVHVQPFHLVEKTVGTGGNGLVAVYPARGNGPDRGLVRLHITNLDRGGVGTQQEVRVGLDEKGVLHVPRRMVLGQVQGRKIIDRKSTRLNSSHVKI